MARHSEETVPYVDAVWQSSGDRSVLLIDAREHVRQEVVTFLEVFGYQVSWAPNPTAAAKLFARMAPDVIVADLETLAPDFEPLRPCLEVLFGEGTPRPVVLIGVDRPREALDWVRAEVADPTHPGGREELLMALETLTARPSPCP